MKTDFGKMTIEELLKYVEECRELICLFGEDKRFKRKYQRKMHKAFKILMKERGY